VKNISLSLLCILVIGISSELPAKDNPKPAGEMLSLGYLSQHSFADALIKYKSLEDRLKANPTDRAALWETALTYFVIANNDNNYVNRCLEAWDTYLKHYPNDGFALWNRGFVKHYFKVGTPCGDIQAATQWVKKKFLPREPEEFSQCFKKKYR
jgi:hypothetical protein